MNWRSIHLISLTLLSNAYEVYCDKISSKNYIMSTACLRNRHLSFCKFANAVPTVHIISPSSRSTETSTIETEHYPFGTNRESGVIEKDDLVIGDEKADLPKTKEDVTETIVNTDTALTDDVDRENAPEIAMKHSAHLSPADIEQLQKKCYKFYPVAAKLCNNTNNAPEEVREKCKAYSQDCYPYLPKSNVWDTLKNGFSGSVDVVPFDFNMHGIPFYPINEEGSIGIQQKHSVPYGAYGGGYAGSTGVRDFWSQYTEAGANWIDGHYGYKTGWSMPLVQSLGVEGHGGTHVAVPLNNRDFGKIGVDTGYGVGGYYAHNDHTGVDWKEGNVNHQFGVGVPFAGVGVNTGTAVAFPSLNTWLRALGS